MSTITLLARRVLPAPVRASVNQLLAPSRARRLARRISKDYSRHYAAAQARYRADGPDGPDGHRPAGTRPSLAAVGVRTLAPGSGATLFTLPPAYSALIRRISSDATERLSWSRNSWFHPQPVVLAERTDEVDEVRRGDVLTLALKDCLSIDGLEELCAQIVPELERAVYGAYVLVDKVYVLRTLVSHHRELSSWVWHYDEHPLEILKLLIYLTDVDEDSAPFTYLVAPDSGEAVMGTKTPLFGQSRMPASTMDSYLARGYRSHAVTGPRGTAVLFNDNVIHRATFATRRPRDILTLQLRPSLSPRIPYVDPGWTGSFSHRDFNRNPEQVEPQLRPVA